MEFAVKQLQDLCTLNDWNVAWHPRSRSFYVLQQSKILLNLSAEQLPPTHPAHHLNYWDLQEVLALALPQLYKLSK